MAIIKFFFRVIVGLVALALRIIGSLILGLIVGLLAVVYLNTGSGQRQRIVAVMAYILGERTPKASTLKMQQAALVQRADGGYEVTYG